MMHSTSSNLQLVHGAPCSTTLHRTFRARQHWQAFDARRFTGRKVWPAGFPATVEDLFWAEEEEAEEEEEEVEETAVASTSSDRAEETVTVAGPVAAMAGDLEIGRDMVFDGQARQTHEGKYVEGQAICGGGGADG